MWYFLTKNLNYNLRSQTDFIRTCDNTSSYGLNSLKYVPTKKWDIVSYDIKSVENLTLFKKRSKKLDVIAGYANNMFTVLDMSTLNIIIIH